MWIRPGNLPETFLFSSIRLIYGEIKSRRADSNRLPLLITSDHSGVAGVCTGLQMPHIQAAFSSLACSVLHRIAFPVVSEWYQDERQLQSDSRSNGTPSRPSLEPQSADTGFRMLHSIS